MNCPHCGELSFVLESRPAPGNTIRRRRICEGCLTRFSSYEIPSTDDGGIPKDLPLPKNITDRAYRMTELRKNALRTANRRKRVCKYCELWSNHGCSLGIPEAGGLTAVACKHFESIHS